MPERSREPAEPSFCYLTTTGRITGRPHRIEIWFALHDDSVYVLSGGRDRSDWVRNVMVSPDVVLEIGDRKRTSRARVVEPNTEEDTRARSLLVQKYQPDSGDDLTDWGARSLPVAIAWP